MCDVCVCDGMLLCVCVHDMLYPLVCKGVCGDGFVSTGQYANFCIFGFACAVYVVSLLCMSLVVCVFCLISVVCVSVRGRGGGCSLRG